MRYVHFFILFLCLSPACFAKPVSRVITLSPHATEIAFAAGLGDKVIAVSKHSDYPLQAQKLPEVANYHGLNIEKILALKPDLVISWPDGNPPKEINKLKRMGLRIYPSHISTLSDIAQNIEDLSQFADNPQEGLKNAQHIRDAVTALKHKYQHRRKVTYFYQLSSKPLITMARHSWPAEVFDLCGGVNVFRDAITPYPQVSLEKVLLARPEVIFKTDEQSQKENLWSEWPDIPAVKHHHIWSVHADWMNRPTPRTLYAVKEVCRYFDSVRQNH
ncbi:Vitamin B12-binding protein precursor [Vibrio aerogenes CECT 7868]|uniref:Vitamin B12-binding protein n=1 Tax=Vibrio aerogenes CECT 7868 TaxID=1216006 RepID=A0A1M5WQV4_9VIBR|nr:vitamin B12 ABC transporter substrate-binding protein BtuF [Vibrio aerogenes]SHH89742.1 Vitamin B12-binding protein precursor [Vibrio aerogenes CECT 7868]